MSEQVEQKHTPEPRTSKGRCNSIIRDAIASGLHLAPDGHIVLPSGKRAMYSRDPKGYNRISLGPSGRRRSFTVARVVCWLTNGEPPHPSMVVDHIDQNPANDEPNNLRWATTSENALNTPDEVRANWGQHDERRGVYGEDQGFKHLTDADVLSMRAECGPIERPRQSDLAKRYGVGQSTVQRILTGERWPHLPLYGDPDFPLAHGAACRGIPDPQEALDEVRQALREINNISTSTRDPEEAIRMMGQFARSALHQLSERKD